MLTGRVGRRKVVMALMLSVGIGSVGGCSRRMLATFFDLPQPTARAAPELPRVGTPAEAVPSTQPPTPFEATLDPDSATKLLPRDKAGNIDWVAAMRREIIRPRATLPGRPLARTDFQFNYDFNMKNADTSYDVSFPHSTHVEWLSCNSCHPRIFRYRGTRITMDDLGKGAFCAECHDKVAFPVETGCERCHTRLPAADGGAKPTLLGTTTLSRARPDAAKGSAASGNAAAVGAGDLPPARFAHWVHRSRYQCKACHMELYVPQAGANVVTMKMIADGQSCGTCHDGKTAFDAGISNCERCHAQPPKTPARK